LGPAQAGSKQIALQDLKDSIPLPPCAATFFILIL
jgi:hypothetical protein